MQIQLTLVLPSSTFMYWSPTFRRYRHKLLIAPFGKQQIYIGWADTGGCAVA